MLAIQEIRLSRPLEGTFIWIRDGKVSLKTLLVDSIRGGKVISPARRLGFFFLARRSQFEASDLVGDEVVPCVV